MANLKSSYPRYHIHKYWGKKPAAGISPLVDRYSQPGDTIIDPFSGYGVFCCEAYLKNRNVIINDLNPIANYIAQNLFSKDVNTNKVRKEWTAIKKELIPFVNRWYEVNLEGKKYLPISVLRTKSGVPIQFTYREDNKTFIKEFPEELAADFCKQEDSYIIEDWYPADSIIENSRISAFPGMHIADLFTKRTLACHARLFYLIDKYSSGAEKDLFLIAFTANLANCSKLVPPIKSRGPLAQGAWMTGFYIGDTFIENNVAHYFENRLNKAIKGKEDFLQAISGNLLTGPVRANYTISNFDAKHLNLPDNSVDYVFTDPPYGDSVPYFEQSVIWNAWLKSIPNYSEEIVISDSNKREKDIIAYEKDINEAFSEIRRILKDGKYFSLTFHSLSGMEWRAISNACVLNNFIVVDYEWLEQKTYPPRQLSRLKSIKGDVLITFQKNPGPAFVQFFSDEQLTTKVTDYIFNTITHGVVDTNSIMMSIMEWILRNMIIVGDVDVFKILNENFNLNKNGEWGIICIDEASKIS